MTDYSKQLVSECADKLRLLFSDYSLRDSLSESQAVVLGSILNLLILFENGNL